MYYRLERYISVRALRSCQCGKTVTVKVMVCASCKTWTELIVAKAK